MNSAIDKILLRSVS